MICMFIVANFFCRDSGRSRDRILLLSGRPGLNVNILIIARFILLVSMRIVAYG
jgi:hypothetical protein